MLSERLKKIRTEHKLTQQNIADVLGIDRTTYTFYERGTTKPSAETLTKIASIYNVTVGYLLGVEKNHPERRIKPADTDPTVPLSASDPISLLPKDERVLLVCYRVLSNQGKELAVEQLKNLTAEYGKSINTQDEE